MVSCGESSWVLNGWQTSIFPLTYHGLNQVVLEQPLRTKKLEQFLGVLQKLSRLLVVLSIAVDYFWTKLILY
ncbi:KLTH0D18040p [Lachancea thermotolerans CBS 6340]|uniref:KLTH0D18040p n=1 Tax=Lachancea thermotolerans (strain ATCC 56472 / CBS 6340 / NRRL Y-8284) TaxID=559295 RepID=C5DFU6_LACTC|nr:KLTH0D18040p [Lachancea thermotolerans CBS 6340]CAR23051.1 KLTH0D18040p [Lachancea thermotolerans CBS 6340]